MCVCCVCVCLCVCVCVCACVFSIFPFQSLSLFPPFLQLLCSLSPSQFLFFPHTHVIFVSWVNNHACALVLVEGLGWFWTLFKFCLARTEWVLQCIELCHVSVPTKHCITVRDKPGVGSFCVPIVHFFPLGGLGMTIN